MEVSKYKGVSSELSGELQNFSAGELLVDETKSINKLLFNTSILFKLYLKKKLFWKYMREPGRGPSPEYNPGMLTLDFPASRTLRNKFLWFISIAARTD